MKVAILGYGTVGAGVYGVICKNNDIVSKRAGEKVEVKYVLDLREFPGDPVESILVHDFEIIVNDPEVGVVVEVMGGVKPAYDFVKRSLMAGKSVCTSNKELVAKYGAELLAIAKDKNINFLFEASVGGGIPIIRPLNESITADDIESITGILNGTTNYILTQMKENGVDFDTALKDAQAKGFAERNPAADIEGFDACRKIAILTSLAYGQQVDFEDIKTEGITKVTAEDIEYADALGMAIKLCAMSRKDEGKVYAMVAPRMLDADNPLYPVKGVLNAILLHGNMLGDVMFYGSGAGRWPTASAVVSDVVDAVKHKNGNIMQIWDAKKLELADSSEMVNRFFVRVEASDKAKAESLFAIAKEAPEVVKGEFAFITEPETEKAFAEKAEKLAVKSVIRVGL